MTNEELLNELESLVEAMEQVVAITIGTVAETGDPVAVLKHVLSGEQVMSVQYGPNEWRDRLMLSARRMAALKARPHVRGDSALQSLIATLLSPEKEPGARH